MATIQSFEEIKAWQKARELNKEVYKISNTGDFYKDYGLKDQIRRSSISILSNIAEGFERNGTKEFLQFLFIAKASAGECRAQLYVAFDLDYISKNDFDKLLQLVTETSKMISGLISYLQSSDFRGSKFKEPNVVYNINNFEL